MDDPIATAPVLTRGYAACAFSGLATCFLIFPKNFRPLRLTQTPGGTLQRPGQVERTPRKPLQRPRQIYFRLRTFAVNDPLMTLSPLLRSMSPAISSAVAVVTFT